MNEDIANALINGKEVIVKKVNLKSTYDPCNVCKRDIISRAIIYPKATFDVKRPVFFDPESKKRIPVRGNDDFKEFLKQNNI